MMVSIISAQTIGKRENSLWRAYGVSGGRSFASAKREGLLRPLLELPQSLLVRRLPIGIRRNGRAELHHLVHRVAHRVIRRLPLLAAQMILESRERRHRR